MVSIGVFVFVFIVAGVVYVCVSIGCISAIASVVFWLPGPVPALLLLLFRFPGVPGTCMFSVDLGDNPWYLKCFLNS